MVLADGYAPGEHGAEAQVASSGSRATTTKSAMTTVSPVTIGPAVLTIVAVIVLAAGCAQRPTPPPAAFVPARATTRAQPQDWFHQQVVAARTARREHQPKTDTAGAQRAYDDVMRTACTRAALAGPGKYPKRCDSVLHPVSDQSPIDSCIGGADDPAMPQVRQ
jgi:hypothetical protein